MRGELRRAVRRIETIEDLLREVAEARERAPAETEAVSRRLQDPDELLDEEQRHWLRTPGWMVLVAVIMLLAGSGKLFGFAPEMVVEQLEGFGLGDDLALIGLAEVASAILLLITRTSSLGVLMTSSFWGGAIVAHMAGDDYAGTAVPIVLLVLTWAGALLRHPEMLASFTGRPGAACEVNPRQEPG